MATHSWQDIISKNSEITFYLHNLLKTNSLITLDGFYHRKPKFIIAEISTFNAINLLLAVVYRLPNCRYLHEFENAFLDHHAYYRMLINYRHSIIFGDFNADLLVALYDTSRIFEFVESSSFHLPQATLNLINSSTLLDLCIVDDPLKLVRYG